MRFDKAYPLHLLVLNCLLIRLSCLVRSFSVPVLSVIPFANHAREYEIENLSEDPKCFLVHNFLSPEECERYISKADSVGPETMQQSNAPEVSIQRERLWPLPLLGIGAGIPSVLHLFEEADNPTNITFQTIFSVVMPPILIAFGVMLVLVFLVQKTIQKYAEVSSRTSTSVALNTEEDCDFIRGFVSKASEITDHSWDHWEAPVITCYDKGAFFSSHNDSSPNRGSEWADLGGQRVVTVITYLNTCTNGGATKFDQLGFQVQPKKGSALFFYPADADTLEADDRTRHQSVSI